VQKPRSRQVITVAAVLAFLVLSGRVCLGNVARLNLDPAPGPTRFIVVFSSRPLSPAHGSLGHAFVAWGAEDSTGELSWVTAYGFRSAHPLLNGVGLLGAVPGSLVEEDMSSVHSADERLIVYVPKSAYDQTLSVRNGWKDQDPEYQIAVNDCVTFTNTIAKTLGLAVPARSSALLPQTYLPKLMKLNDAVSFDDNPAVTQLQKTADSIRVQHMAKDQHEVVVGRDSMQRLRTSNQKGGENNLRNNSLPPPASSRSGGNPKKLHLPLTPCLYPHLHRAIVTDAKSTQSRSNVDQTDVFANGSRFRPS
jgi:hypothetical protein